MMKLVISSVHYYVDMVVMETGNINIYIYLANDILGVFFIFGVNYGHFCQEPWLYNTTFTNAKCKGTYFL